MNFKKLKFPFEISLKNITFFLLFCSIFALVLAYIAQYVFDYQPCILCLYQRLPFFSVIGFSLLSLFFLKQKKLQKFVIFFCAFFLAINAGIAVYQVGVEQKVFAGPSTCSSKNLDKITDLKELEEALKATKAVRCDEPELFFLGLSMASWNLIYCCGLIFITMNLIKKRN
jgi:disulfide bond formation protein DsbB